MKNKLIELIKNQYPVLSLLFIVAFLFGVNYQSNTYLTGWDNLHPEFDFGINIKRSIFAVWQEYQGLGLLGGMGHASDLFRQLFLLAISVIFPDNLLRYIWVFITMFIGSLGTYYLINYVLRSVKHENKLISFAGAVFYLLNISSIQVFFIPFEAFVAHYAFLPWVVLSSIHFIRYPNYKTALVTFLAFFITSPQAYIPTLFVSTLMAITILSLPFYYREVKRTLKSFLSLLLLIFLSNSFWLLPFIFFTLTNSSVNIDSKINQMATDFIFLQNKEFGDIINVPLLKGYLFSNVEPDATGKFDYILGVWRDYFKNPVIILASYFLFGIILAGIIKAIRTKNKMGIAFVLLFVFGFTMLATNIPLFSHFNAFLREYIPLFNQAFRFPYTKFLSVASLGFSVMLAFGILFITGLAKKKILKTLFPTLVIFLIILISLPAFYGKLFYFKEKLTVPPEYFQTFNYFKNENPNTRIANFPQYTFWGWNFYNWDYSGSGFLWYGIDQPILDRAFDVWSSESENYYWEVSHALYSKNPIKLQNVLYKYDINYILIDKNVINPVSPKSVFTTELKELISELPEIKKTKDFGNIEIYSVELENKPDNFISSLPTLSSANPYVWSDHDQAYEELGDYSNSPDYSDFYPFRAVFEGKSSDLNLYKISITDETVQLSAPLPSYNERVNLQIPSPVTSNNFIPVHIIAQKTNGRITVSLKVTNPDVNIKTGNNVKKVWENNVSQNLFEFNSQLDSFKLNINGVSDFEAKELGSTPEVIGTTSLSLEQNNSIVLLQGNRVIDSENVSGPALREWFVQDEAFITIPKIEKNSHILLNIPKLNDKYSSHIIDPSLEISEKRTEVNNCDNFRKQYFSYFIKVSEEKRLLELAAENAIPCVAFYMPTLDHNQAYLVGIENKNLSDRNLHFWVLNQDAKAPVIDKYLEKTDENNISYVVLPSMERFGKAYSFHFDNASIGPSKSWNQLGEITINPIPYYFIANLKVENPSLPPLELNKINFSVQHPNQSLYLIEKDISDEKSAISLSQSYSPYWKAYEVNNFNILSRSFPFIFGKSTGEHVKINNWKNGWILEPSGTSKLVIVYLPQYLEYLGFALSTGTLFVLFYLYIKEKRRHHKAPHHS